ncbi:unnamed protein product, partial [Didymodactylos carnosus]
MGQPINTQGSRAAKLVPNWGSVSKKHDSAVDITKTGDVRDSNGMPQTNDRTNKQNDEQQRQKNGEPFSDLVNIASFNPVINTRSVQSSSSSSATTNDRLSSSLSSRSKHTGSSQGKDTGTGLTRYTTEPYSSTATQASHLVKSDKKECQVVIKKYGVDPDEMLHLIERWTQKVIEEFQQDEECFKIILKKKWDKKELKGITLDASNYHTKTLFDNIRKLKESNLNVKHNMLVKDVLLNDDIKDTLQLKLKTADLIDESLQTIT